MPLSLSSPNLLYNRTNKFTCSSFFSYTQNCQPFSNAFCHLYLVGKSGLLRLFLPIKFSFCWVHTGLRIFMQPIKFISITVILFVATIDGNANNVFLFPTSLAQGSMKFRLTAHNMWTSDRFTNAPANSKLSQVLGCVAPFSFWASGITATPEVRSFVQTGDPTQLYNHLKLNRYAHKDLKKLFTPKITVTS